MKTTSFNFGYEIGEKTKSLLKTFNMAASNHRPILDILDKEQLDLGFREAMAGNDNSEGHDARHYAQNLAKASFADPRVAQSGNALYDIATTFVKGVLDKPISPTSDAKADVAA